MNARTAFAMALMLGLSVTHAGSSTAAAAAPGPQDDILKEVCERKGTAFLEDHPCEAWIARYEGPLKGWDVPQGMAISPDGSAVFVTGYSAPQQDRYNNAFVTLGYDARTGAELWRSEYDVPGGLDVPYPFDPITVSPDASRVYVVGVSAGAGMSTDFVTIAYDAATGEEIWLDRYDHPGGGSDIASQVSVSEDGSRLYVTGDSTPAGSANTDVATIAYDAVTGARLWRTAWGGSLGAEDYADAQILSPDGTRLYTASTGWNTCPVCGKGIADEDFALTAYDTTDRGNVLWTRFYNDPETARERAQALEISPDGTTVYIGATRAGPSGLADHCVLVAHDAFSGAIRWETRQEGPNCFVNDLTASPDGSSIYATTTVATFAYEAATGAERWRRTEPWEYTKRHEDAALSPDGSKIVVVGQNEYDLWTVIYATGSGEPLFRARLDTVSGDEYGLMTEFAPDGSRVFSTARVYFGNNNGLPRVSTNPPGLYEDNNEDFLTVAYDLERRQQLAEPEGDAR